MCGQRQAWGGASLSKLALVLSRAPEVQRGGLRNREQEAEAPHMGVEVEGAGHMWEQVEGAPHRQVEAETHKQEEVEEETRRQEVGEGALPPLVGAPHIVELAAAHMWEVEVVGAPHILVEVGVSRTRAPHAPPEVHTLAEVGVVEAEHSGCGDGSGPCAWCGRCGRP